MKVGDWSVHGRSETLSGTLFTPWDINNCIMKTCTIGNIIMFINSYIDVSYEYQIYVWCVKHDTNGMAIY